MDASRDAGSIPAASIFEDSLGKTAGQSQQGDWSAVIV